MLSNLSKEELYFCIDFEAKFDSFRFLHACRNALTAHGKVVYAKERKWLSENLDKYLLLTGNVTLTLPA